MKILVFGTFDIFHKGHEYFLNEAKKLGDELTVVVARDRTVEEVKGHKPRNSEGIRLESIQSLSLVDNAILGSEEEDKYRIIEEVNPDIIALGYDQNGFADNLFDELIRRRMHTKIIRLKPYKPEKYKSSKLR